ncbi:MAG TPA: hypothetical protein VI431_12185 [Candidatus Acidoferrum sp.]
MKTTRRRQTERGIALLIAIFILLLIGVVAIALIVSSGTESALAGNYRSSTGVYYAAAAGLEEVRARLRSNNPNSFNNVAPGFLPPAGNSLGICAPVYVINPLGGEAITPWDQGSTYPDTEFAQEFGAICGGGPPSPSPTTPSVWSQAPLNGLAFPAPLYKWVRINGVSEQSMRLDVFPYDTTIDPTLLYYDGSKLDDTITGGQVLEVTALAVLPNGSQKLLQYLVASVPPFFNNFPPNLLSFPAALTLDGNATNSVAFSAPKSSSSYFVSGADLTPSCGTGPAHAIGVFDDPPDKFNVINGGNGGSGIPVAMQSKYAGVTNPGPDVVNVITAGLLSPNLQDPSQVDAIAQTIMQNADVVIPSGVVTYPLPTINGSQLSANTTAMSPSSPETVVVNGNLDLTGWHNTGYGMLVVTGKLNYDPDASWQGMILVIGQGTVTGSLSGTGEIDGEVFVATTRDASGKLLADLGKASMNFGNNMGGTGIRYSSCWVQKAQPISGFKILSFHELSQ